MAAVEGRTLLWTLVDASSDIPYENTVKGSEVTAIDNVMDNMVVGGSLSRWFSLHTAYFQNVATSLSNWSTALATWKWRASEFWAKAYYEALGTKIPVAYVFPRDDLDLGSYTKTSSTFTAAADTMDTTFTNGGKIAAKATSAIGGSNLVLTGTLKRLDDTTVSIQATVSSGASIGDEFIFGERVLGADAAAAQAVLSVGATAQFKVGEPVLVEDDDDQEYGVVASIVTNTSITLTANLKNAYGTADNAKVTPLFKAITNCSHSGGTNGDTVDFVVAPDRVVDFTDT
jgi:hypothetical protein